MSASAIYEGSVRHRRFAERHNEFSAGLALAYLDLDELPGLLGGRLVAKRPGIVRFRAADYLAGDALRRRTGTSGPIRLLTNLRTFGHCFNPVSLYYCFEDDGQTLGSVVAEVTNTPWGERHSYVIGGDGGQLV